MNSENKQPSMRERVQMIMRGEKPDCMPFVDRLSFWYKTHLRAGTLPDSYKNMTEHQIHEAVGMGHAILESPIRYKYHGVEIISHHDGKKIFHEMNPELVFFPALWYLIPGDKPGVTTTEFITPVGKLITRHQVLQEMIDAGNTGAHIMKPVITSEEDYAPFEYMIEHAELLPDFDQFNQQEDELGDHGYLVPWIGRIPFQKLLYDVFGGGEKLYFGLHDNPKGIERLLTVLDEQVVGMLHQLADFEVPYVEFMDNMDGFFTSPNLFEKYCLPAYQSYAGILHGQGKKMGSHTDGNLKPLLSLIADSGIDIAESVTPAPITQTPLDEILAAWENGPLIWGGIPSYYLEERVSQKEFEVFIDQFLSLIGDRTIIFGIGDAVMGDNMIERVQSIAEMIENHE
jgi:hypothetical protein